MAGKCHHDILAWYYIKLPKQKLNKDNTKDLFTWKGNMSGSLSPRQRNYR